MEARMAAKSPGGEENNFSIRIVASFRALVGLPSGSRVKSLPAMQKPQETWARFLGWEDPLEKETATHSSIVAWRTPWTEEPGGLQSMWSQESDMT